MSILTAAIPTIVSEGMEFIKDRFPSEIEKEKAKQEFIKATQDRFQDTWEQAQEQLTSRHANDMRSDSWLSKNIRPLSLIGLFFLLAYIVVAGGVKEHTASIVENLLHTAFIFYFGSRGLEKVILGRRDKEK